MAALVGRDTEMARLRALLDDAAAGRAVTALVGGDAGVGKSRLVAEVMTVAGRSGFTVLCGQCAEIGDSVPYLPFADAFRTAPPHIEQVVKARPVLARLLPDGGEPAHGDRPVRHGPSADVRRGARGAGRARRREPGAARPRGPALGRRDNPPPGDVPGPHAAPRTRRHRRHLPHGRPAPAASARRGRGGAGQAPVGHARRAGPAACRRARGAPVEPAERAVAPVHRPARQPGRAGGGQCLLRGRAARRLVGIAGSAALRPRRAAAGPGGARVRRGAAGAAGGGRRRAARERPAGPGGFRS